MWLGIRNKIGRIKRLIFRLASRNSDSFVFASPETFQKGEILLDRFREVISDPLNTLIERVPESGFVDDDGFVRLHNGNKVSFRGPNAYYGGFSDLLIFNRGVHEPLEEYCFQEVLKKIDVENPSMLELGSYWAHYSMWLLKKFPAASVHCVEPDSTSIAVGKFNFALNGYVGNHINSGIGDGVFTVDRFLEETGLYRMQILHCDIQGAEVKMLDGAFVAFQSAVFDYVFISTHSNGLHDEVLKYLRSHGYIIEVSSDFESHTTSYDGFILARSANAVPVMSNFEPLGRTEILASNPHKLVDYLRKILNRHE